MKFLHHFFLPSVAKLTMRAINDAEIAIFENERTAEEYECEASKLRLKATMLRDRIDTLTAEQDTAIIAEGANK